MLSRLIEWAKRCLSENKNAVISLEKGRFNIKSVRWFRENTVPYWANMQVGGRSVGAEDAVIRVCRTVFQQAEELFHIEADYPGFLVSVELPIVHDAVRNKIRIWSRDLHSSQAKFVIENDGLFPGPRDRADLPPLVFDPLETLRTRLDAIKPITFDTPLAESFWILKETQNLMLDTIKHALRN
jgi:hypothetical protein